LLVVEQVQKTVEEAEEADIENHLVLLLVVIPYHLLEEVLLHYQFLNKLMLSQLEEVDQIVVPMKNLQLKKVDQIQYFHQLHLLVVVEVDSFQVRIPMLLIMVLPVDPEVEELHQHRRQDQDLVEQVIHLHQIQLKVLLVVADITKAVYILQVAEVVEQLPLVLQVEMVLVQHLQEEVVLEQLLVLQQVLLEDQEEEMVADVAEVQETQ
jgi:hypothetical protein|tara:strand:- start:10 stop:636 length:627 start_codon:yes stop_codon:yes gene_type:complete